MKKIYLVDSENVGDIWVPLLVASQAEDEVIVFYTQKSPHMNYENVRMLKETDKEADFIKCFEGSNALDFQLVSELGYRLHENQECDYVIVSNDTGFDAVVRYWSQRKMPVSRLSGKDCYRQLNGKKKGTGEKVQPGVMEPQPDAERQADAAAQEMTTVAAKEREAEVMEGNDDVTRMQPGVMEPQRDAGRQAEEPEITGRRQDAAEAGTDVVAEKPDAGQQAAEQRDAGRRTAKPEITGGQPDAAEAGADAAVEKPNEREHQTDAAVMQPEDTEQPSGMQPAMDADTLVKTLACCISKENLVDFHNALVALLGEDEGKRLYQEIKGNAEYTLYWSTLPASSQKEKFELYCGLVFAHSEFAEEAPEDFAGFLYQANGKRKNLNSLRAALQGHYGKDKGMKYYSLFKSHIKIMNRM